MIVRLKLVLDEISKEDRYTSPYTPKKNNQRNFIGKWLRAPFYCYWHYCLLVIIFNYGFVGITAGKKLTYVPYK